MFNRHSISVKYTLAIISVLFVMIAVGTGVFMARQYRLYERELRESLTVAAEVSKISLASPLWFMNEVVIHDFLRALFLDQRLVWINIVDQNGVVISHAAPGMEGKPLEFFQTSDDFMTHAAEISYEGKNIAHLDLAASRLTIQQKLRTIFLLAIEAGSAFFAILAFSSMWITHRQIVLPLTKMIRAAEKVSDGELDQDSGVIMLFQGARHELGRLNQEFSRMVLYLQSMAKIAARLSVGDLDQQIQPRTPHDALGNAFQRMVAYLKQMGDVATHIAQGDLCETIETRGPKDRLGNAFTAMQDGLIALISNIRTGAEYLSSISNLVLISSSKSTNVLQEIGTHADSTSAAMHEVSASGQEISRNMHTLTLAVEDTSLFIDHMAASVTQLAEHSRNLSDFTQEATATIVQIASSLTQISGQAKYSRQLSETTMQDAISGFESVEQVIASTTTMSEVTEHIFQVITRLGSHSGEIATIVDVINDVAEQTSLLALNASIIASQSGAHGKGFSVVAAEIKELAVRVRVSTKEIANIIKGVQKEVAVAVKAIRQGQNEVQRGVQLAQKADDALHKIRESAENSSNLAIEIDELVAQQAKSQTRMIDEIHSVSRMIQQMDEAILEQQGRASDLASIMSSLHDLENHVQHEISAQQNKTLQVSHSMERVLMFVHEHFQTAHELAASANELAFQANALKEHAEQFRIPGHESAPTSLNIKEISSDRTDDDISTALDSLFSS